MWVRNRRPGRDARAAETVFSSPAEGAGAAVGYLRRFATAFLSVAPAVNLAFLEALILTGSPV